LASEFNRVLTEVEAIASSYECVGQLGVLPLEFRALVSGCDG
jgi:hypothetical protein